MKKVKFLNDNCPICGISARGHTKKFQAVCCLTIITESINGVVNYQQMLEEEIFVPEISPIAYTQALAVLVRINEEEGSKRLGESVFHEFWKNCEAMAHNFSRHTDLTKDWSKLE